MKINDCEDAHNMNPSIPQCGKLTCENSSEPPSMKIIQYVNIWTIVECLGGNIIQESDELSEILVFRGSGKFDETTVTLSSETFNSSLKYISLSSRDNEFRNN